MKRSAILFLFVVFVLTGTIPAHASQSGVLTLNGTGSNESDSGSFPEQGMTYPYYFSLNVNNTVTSLTLMCDDLTDDVLPQEYWNVNIFTITDIINSENLGSEVGQMSYTNGLLGVTANSVTQGTGPNNGLDAEQRAYVEAAYMYQYGGLVNGSSSQDVIVNEAVWELFAASGYTNPFGASDQSQISSLFTSAQNFTMNMTQATAESDFSNVRFYTPSCSPAGSANCGQGGPNAPYNSRPQEYIGSVPEPGTLALLATGLIGLGIVTRRKGLRSTNL